MSYQLMAWASAQTTGSPTRKAVLLALANRANHEDGLCYPSVELLAAETELSERAVRQALTDLAESGLISRTRRRRADGSLGVYDYYFPPALSAPPPAAAAARTTGTTCRTEPGSKPSNQGSPSTKAHRRDELWETLTHWQGVPEGEEERKSLNAALGKIKGVMREMGIDPASEEAVAALKLRIENYWPDIDPSAHAISKHWGRLGRVALNGSEDVNPYPLLVADDG